jgi:alpha-beta hydrolase superfamily lysophospholipase
MEFTAGSAEQLNVSLAAVDFASSITDPGLADRQLLNGYLSLYGLDRLRAPWPIRQCLGSFSSLEYRLICQYFAVPEACRRGSVVIVHGYYDHVGLFRHAIEYCLSRGCSVLAFDLPGHGLSSGDPASIDSFDHYSQALVDCLAVAGSGGLEGPWHVLAQSTGAATVINGLLNQDKFQLGDFDKIMLLAPLLRPTGWKQGLRKYYLLRWFVNRVKRDFAVNSHDEEFLNFVFEKDPLQTRFLKVDWIRALKAYLEVFETADSCNVPLHILQGTEDTTVDWRYNLPRLTAKFPAARPHIVEGARHHMVNESESYRGKIFAVMDEILGYK